MSHWLEPLAHGSRAYLLLTLFCACMYLPGIASIPVLDRDEARYVQASRQMLESGDFVRIRFQDTPRHKKPVAVYWLQAGAAALLGNSHADNIAPYRLVSAVSAWLTVLLTLALAKRLFQVVLCSGNSLDSRAKEAAQRPESNTVMSRTSIPEQDQRASSADLGALLAALLLAASFGLMSEAHQAKTDALLCLFVVLMQLGLCQVLLLPSQPAESASDDYFPWLFWIGLGLGTLTKGPVAPAIAVLTVLALLLQQRSWRLVRALHPARGTLLCLAIVAPWSVAIYLATDGQFFSQAANEDFLPKLVSAQESHGAAPGYYLLVMLAMFWPGSMLALPALGFTLHRLRGRTEMQPPSQSDQHIGSISRIKPAVAAHSSLWFVLCWLIPTWVVLELIPTKLPHYTLPLYPALALLVGMTALAMDKPRERSAAPLHTGLRWLWAGYSALWLLVSLALAAAVVAVPLLLKLPLLLVAVAMALVLGIGSVIVCVQIRRQRLLDALLCGVGASLIFSVLLTAVYVPALKPMWISQRLATIVAVVDPHRMAKIYISGYHEPSVVFTLGTQTQLTDSATALKALNAEQPIISIMATAVGSASPSIAAVHAQGGVLIGRFEGFNYSKGKPLLLSVFTNQSMSQTVLDSNLNGSGRPNEFGRR